MRAWRVVVRVEKGKKRWRMEAMVEVLLKSCLGFGSWWLLVAAGVGAVVALPRGRRGCGVYRLGRVWRVIARPC